MLGRRASVFAFTDDITFYPGNYDEVRWPQFVIRSVLMVLLVILALYPVLDSKALWIDDADAAREIFLRTGAGVARMWRPTSQATYQPVADTLLAVQYRLWFQRAGGFHAVSVMLHASNAVLVWLLLRRLSVPGAWLGAAVFALHPGQVQAAGFVGGQAQLWMTLFFVAGLILYLRFLSVEPDPPVDPTVVWLGENAEHAAAPPEEMTVPLHPRRWLFYGLSLALFLAAVGCGTAAACFPAVVLLVLWWRHGGALRSDLAPLAPFVAVAATSYLLEVVRVWRITAASEADAGQASPPERFFTAARALFVSVRSFFWPLDSVFAHPSWQGEGRPAWHYAFLPAGIAIFAALWALRRRIGTGPLVALTFFALVLVPPLLANGYGWSERAPVGDHRQYLANLGLIALTVGLVIHLVSRLAIGPARTLRFAVGLVVVLGATVLAFGRARTFAEPATVWDHVVARYPTFIDAHRRLAGIHLENKRYGEAQDSVEAITRANPNDPDAWVELGSLYENRGDVDEAIAQYRWALRIDADNPRANVKLGVLLRKQNRLGEAESYLARAAALTPGDPAILDELGQVYALTKRPDEAIAVYQKAIRLDPRTVLPRIHLAHVFFSQKRFQEAANMIQEAAQIDPRNYEAFMSAGSMLGSLNDFVRAERMFRAAARIKPDAPEAHNNLGVSLVAQDRLGEAIYSFRKAIDLRPDFDAARRNLIAAEQRNKLGPRQRQSTGAPGFSIDGVRPGRPDAPATAPSTRPARTAPAAPADAPPPIRPTTLPGGR